MVQLRKDRDGKMTWTLEGETLAERLEELAVIFNYYSREGGENRLDPRFIAELMTLETKALVHMAQQQEKDLKRLRQLESDLALFKAEVLSELNALKNPQERVLDKPALRAPRTGGKPPAAG